MILNKNDINEIFTLGEIIRNAREEKQITIPILVKRFKRKYMNIFLIRKIEMGYCIPGIKFIKIISKLLKIDEKYLIEISEIQKIKISG